MNTLHVLSMNYTLQSNSAKMLSENVNDLRGSVYGDRIEAEQANGSPHGMRDNLHSYRLLFCFDFIFGGIKGIPVSAHS